MTLVDAPVISADDARRLTDQIKVTVEGAWHLITQAYESRAFAALGYSSWDDYCTREFGTSRLRLPREERQEVVASLRESGLSIRAIAAATGINRETVRQEIASAVDKKLPPADAPRDVDLGGWPVDPDRTLEPAAVPPPAPRPVIGIDGKQYPEHKPAVAPRRSPLPDQARSAGWDLRKSVERLERLAADDRFAANKEQVAAEWSGHLSHAVKVCQDLLDGFTTSPAKEN